MKSWFKKNWFVILINFIVVLSIFLIVEFVLYLTSDKKFPFLITASKLHHPYMSEYYEKLGKGKYHDLKKLPKGYHYKLRPVELEYLYRRPVGLGYENMPIVLFGCSYAWGEKLHENQTFHYKLSELTKRPVYNRAMSAWGVQHMLYQLKREDFYKVVPRPEYVIYVYFPLHVQRMYKYDFICSVGKKYNYNYLKYNYSFGKLREEKRLQFVPYSRLLNWYILPLYARLQEKNLKHSFKLFKAHLLECKYEIDKHWAKDGNKTKFIVLDYDALQNNDIFTSENIEKLKKDEIYVIKASDLTDINLDSEPYYLSKDDHHPGEGAWNLITPLLVEKIKGLGL